MVAISAAVASPAPTPPAPTDPAYSGTTDSSRKNPVMAPNEATNTSRSDRLRIRGRGSLAARPGPYGAAARWSLTQAPSSPR